MKAKRYLLVGLFLGALAGWTLGFLRLPYLEKNTSFGVGFLSCLAMGLIGWLLMFVWKKNTWLLQSIQQEPATKGPSKVLPTYTLLWILVAAFIALGGTISSMLIFRQNQLYKNQIQEQSEQLAQQSALTEAARNSNLIVLMNQLSDQINEELNNNPGRSLSEQSIDRIAALNYAFQPYQDSLSEKKWSPERGQLLVLLASLNMDSTSFNAIKQKVSFEAADLEGADLNGVDLSRVDLSGANLKDAQLSGANLSGANLKKAYLWGSQMKKTNLNGADLQNVMAQWVDWMEADLRSSNLNGADITAARLTGADLSQASIMYAELSSAFLNEANLTEADISFTNLRGTNLSNAVLKDALMKTTDLSNAVLEQANMEGVNLRWGVIAEENWFEQLERWQVEGVQSIQERFKIIKDTGGLGNYRLPPRE
jgi:uncharacterized protein YjbI with pentapeptide repeats